MRLLHAVCVVTTILASNYIFTVTATDSKPVDVSKTSSDREPWRETRTTGNNGVSDKRFLRIVESTNQNVNATGSMNETRTSNNGSTAVPSDEEERGVKVAGLSKFFKGKKITTAVTNLLTGNKKQKTLAKLRVKMLESFPPEQAANLIFLKMPKNAPAKLPSKLPKGIKGFDFKIPGVSNAIIRLKMEIWFYYKYPPSYAFKQLGLVGKGSGKVLRAQENYKYFKSYFDAWYESQKHLIF